MTTVRHLLDQKSAEVWSMASTATVREALQVMSEQDIGVVVVVDNTQVTGIFSERDFARRIAFDEHFSLDTPVSELMTSPVIAVGPDQFMDECMAIMTEKRIRHLPVVENGHLVGMISLRDLVGEIVSQKDLQIHSMENYILGREFTG
jgi:CBS domain-containing protein